MNAIASAIETLFADPNIGREALWRAGGGGAPVPVRIVWRAPDTVTNFGSGRFVSAARFLDVRIAQVPALESGDSFEIDGDRYIVQGDPLRDDERLIWSAEVRPELP